MGYRWEKHKIKPPVGSSLSCTEMKAEEEEPSVASDVWD